MAIVPDQSASSTPGGDEGADAFGANDWLLEEMYEQYTADPDSVDATWAEYFKTHGAPVTGGAPAPSGNGSGQPEGKVSPTPRRAAPESAEPTSSAAAQTPARMAPDQPAATATRSSGSTSTPGVNAAGRQSTRRDAGFRAGRFAAHCRPTHRTRQPAQLRWKNRSEPCSAGPARPRRTWTFR